MPQNFQQYLWACKLEIAIMLTISMHTQIGWYIHSSRFRLSVKFGNLCSSQLCHLYIVCSHDTIIPFVPATYRKMVVLETTSNAAISLHVMDREARYSSCSLVTSNLGLPHLPVCTTGTQYARASLGEPESRMF